MAKVERVLLDPMRLFERIANPERGSLGTPDDLPPNPGMLLGRHRREAGLSRSELALAIGYANLSKGANRVYHWERGERRPSREQCVRLDQALELPSGSIEGLWADLDAARRAHDLAREEVRRSDRALLLAHHEFLLARREAVWARAEWANVRVEAASVSLAWIGSGFFTVGELLKGWATETLVCREGDAVVGLLYSASGSVLSGLRSFEAIPRVSDSPGPLPRPSSLTVARSFSQKRPPLSPLSFAQLLSDLGVAPTSVVRDG